MPEKCFFLTFKRFFLKKKETVGYTVAENQAYSTERHDYVTLTSDAWTNGRQNSAF